MSDAHTADSHEQPPQPGVVLAVQPGSLVVAGQSPGHVALLSLLSQVPSPQKPVVAGQSPGHVRLVSLPSQVPLPQLVPKQELLEMHCAIDVYALLPLELPALVHALTHEELPAHLLTHVTMLWHAARVKQLRYSDWQFAMMQV